MSPSAYRVPLRLGVRIIVACLLSLLFCTALGLEQSYPAELTAIIVTQASVGASLKAMVDRFVGSLGGAVWGVAVLLAFDWLHVSSESLILFTTLVPLAFLAVFKPGYRAAPITAIILLFTSGGASSIWTSAVHRMVEIGIGSLVALGVSLVVFPARAHPALVDAAVDVLSKLQGLASALLVESLAQTDSAGLLRRHDELRQSLGRIEVAAEDALQERAAHLTSQADPGPLGRTLRRLRNDLSMIGRIMADPFPQDVEAALAGPRLELGNAITAYFQAIRQALVSRQGGPPPDEVAKRLESYSSAVAELRRSGITRNLSDDEIGRTFGLTFALDQLHQNLQDLADRIDELSAAGAKKRPNAAQA